MESIKNQSVRDELIRRSISQCRDYLLQFASEILKDVKCKIYGVLSKGVHESTDDECMELFPYMQFVIEQILDEEIRKKELDQKVAKLKNKLNS